MDNAVSILLMFLVAALNTIIVVIVVRLIFKVKVDKQNLKDQLKKEAIAELKRNAILKKNKLAKEEKNTSGSEEKIIKPKEEVKSEQITVKTGFLKYTPHGYVAPENDSKLKTHLWR